MRKYILLGLLLWLSVIASLQAENKKVGTTVPAAKQPKAYEAFLKQGMRKIGDVLPIYTNDKQYYLEISKENLNRDLLFSGIIVKGPWCGTSSSITDRLRFTLGKDNTLNVMQEIWDARIDSTKSDPALLEAFKASNMPSVKLSIPVYAYGKDRNSYIIDITKDVTSAGKLFAFPELQWVNRPVASRFSIDTICPLEQGVKFLVIHAQTDRMKGGFGMPGQDKHNTVCIEWAIQTLPESDLTPREADPRVGYNTINYADYSQDPAAIKNKSIIRRWDLDVRPEDRTKYENGELVEPARPILIYLDRTIAGGFRDAAKVAIEEWNGAFAAAGFRNVLQLQEGEAPVQWGYHTITCSFLECLPKNNTVSNPYTGEIIGANMVVSVLDFRRYVPMVQTMLQNYEPRVFSDLKEEVGYQIFRRQFAFQLGCSLGLLSNGASKSAYSPKQLRNKEWVEENGISSSAVGGDLVNYLVQPGDGIALEDLFGHVSSYDRWAIEFGYRIYAPDTEKENIRSLLMLAKNNPLLAYSVKAKNEFTPFDLSSDILEAVKLGIKNIEGAYTQVESLSKSIDEEDSWFNYINQTKWLTELYNNYLRALHEHVGIVRMNPSIKGYTDDAWTFMPRGEQKAIMDYLLEKIYSGVPEWMKYTKLRGLSGYNGEETMTVGMRLTSQFVTNPNVLDRLLLTEQRQPGKAYTATEMYKSINRHVFADFSVSEPVDRVKCRAQFLFAEAFVNNYVLVDVTKNIGTDVANFMMLQMKSTLKSIERLGKTHTTAAGRAHYQGLYVYMKHLMTSADKSVKEMNAGAKKTIL